jgi:hypothetical protein
VTVFILKDSETLVALQPATFAREDDFQHLVAKFPSLLSGGQADDTPPRRWLLIKREKSIPAEDGGGGRFSVDHLFIDEDGVPTRKDCSRKWRGPLTGRRLAAAACGQPRAGPNFSTLPVEARLRSRVAPLQLRSVFALWNYRCNSVVPAAPIR